MRILVLGAGAIGGYFGARLLAAGRDVTFLVREARAEQLARSGLVVRSPQGALELKHPPTVLVQELKPVYDAVIVSCKAYDLADAMASMAAAVTPRTLILPLLNGMAHLEQLETRFSADQVLGGKCVISATLDDAGAIVHLNALHSLSFGERTGGVSPRVAMLHSQLEAAGFDAIASPQIVQDMWEKWVFLASLAASTCLMRASVGSIVAAPHGRALIGQVFDECLAISSQHGHPVPPAIVEQLRTVLTAPGSSITASMLRDMQRGARIEADHIVGDLLARSGSEPSPAQLSALQMAWCHLKSYEASRG